MLPSSHIKEEGANCAMTNFESRIRFGFSPSMLFPKSFEDPYMHFAAIQTCCHCAPYESFETFLPDDAAMRKLCIQSMKEHEITLHYNTPGVFQLDGEFNPCSDNPEYRKNALELAKTQIEYAAEAESPIIVFTGCPDKGEERRPELLKMYMEYFLQLAEFCRTFNIEITIEPIERHRFKKLLLGPCKDCADFMLEAQKNGASNAHLMLDIAHLPLMEETMEAATREVLRAGLIHVHMGDAVLDEKSIFYGHTHPPVGVHNGTFDLVDLTHQFMVLFECGYIPHTTGQKRANISLEVRPYPGCDELTSIRLMYEKMKTACDLAAHKLGIY